MRPEVRTLRGRLFFWMLVAVLSASGALAQQPLEGRVTDPSGRGVSGVEIRVVGAPGVSVTTDGEGRFTLPSLDTPVLLRLRSADGLMTRVAFDPQQSGEVILSDVRLGEQITVTAAPSPVRLSETASSVLIVGRDDIETTAAPTLDDTLRRVPGFTLFRRAGSRTANPTAQGVSLRGVGASGASRTLVLDEGVPLNDPFGGWIYWGRVQREAVERVEIVRGGGAELHGSSALSGVIQVLRRPNLPAYLSMSASAGSMESADASLYTSSTIGDWSGSLAAELFSTGGYVAVAEDARGSVDEAVASERWSLDGVAQRNLDRGRVFVRFSAYDEDRDNGTPLQRNATALGQITSGGELLAGDTQLQLRAYYVDQEYDQTFSAVASDRSSERLTRVQHVPSTALGLSLQASRPLGSRSILSAGADVKRVRGVSLEHTPGAPGSEAENGGTQEIAGLWVHDSLQLGGRTIATLGLRYDTWDNTARGSESARSESALSPRLSVTHMLAGGWTLTGSAYESFRAPTLNELYRPFRVGNVQTLANGDLRAERLRGYEVGALYSRSSRSAMRVVLFDMRVEDPVANVTLDTQPNLITRQRQNLGSTRSRGIEIDGDLRMGRWRVSAGLLHVDPRVTAASDALEGNRIPQIPRNQWNVQLSLEQWGRVAGAIQARWSDDQYENDQNTLTLGEYLLMDAYVSVAITSRLTGFAAAENLFDERYEIGRTPIVTLGAPRALRFGVKFRSSP